MKSITITPMLVATVCFSYCVATCSTVVSYQASRKPSETVEKLYELIGRGDIEGTEKFILFVPGTTDFAITMFQSSLESVALDLKGRGGIRSFTILSEEVAGGQSDVSFEYILADETIAKSKVHLIFDADKWKIQIDPAALIPLPNEIAAIVSVREILKAQILYSVTIGRLKFTDLATLGKEGLIDLQLASGEKQGYLFTSKPISVKDRPAMFDTTAKPKQPGVPFKRSRSYYCNETAVIYQAEGTDPPAATVSNRVPKNASTIP